MTTPIDITFSKGTTITSDWLNGINDGLIQNISDTNTNTTNISTLQTRLNDTTSATIGTVNRTLEDKLTDIISVKDFGAVGDGITDDTVAVQKTIDYALANNKGVLVEGKCLLTSSIILNRQVDTTSNIFRIRAEGSGQGFYVNSAIKLFESTLTYNGVNPVSEFIQFEGVHFECLTPSLAAYIMTEKFLRISFLNCHFQAIKCLTSSTYAQSWYFNNCSIRDWASGTFFYTAGCYDISFLGNLVESGDRFFFTHDPNDSQHASGVRFVGNLIEACTSSAIVIDGARGVLISGNYFEFNGGPTNPNIHLWGGNLSHEGLEISSNYFTTYTDNASDWGIYWGPVTKASVHDNYCYGRLHNNSDVPPAQLAGLSSWGNFASLGVWKTSRVDSIRGIAPASYTQALGGGGAFTINADLYGIFYLATGLSTGNSCAAVSGGVPGQHISIQITNSSGASITSWGFSGNYKTSTWGSQAHATMRTIGFIYNGTNWIEVSRSADIPV